MLNQHFLQSQICFVFFPQWLGDQRTSCSIGLFKKILKEENISIHKPCKDQCDTCCSHKVGNIEDDEYEEHLVKKTEAREAKAAAKSMASDRILVVTMDLQSI